MNLTSEFKTKVVDALIGQRENFSGSDGQFARQYGINSSVYSRLKGGEQEKLLRDTDWLNLGRELGVNIGEKKWNAARTEVFNIIEEDIQFCQENSKARICVDDCGIGKTFTAKYLAKSLKNCFYIDASQAKSKQLFVKLIAKTVGIDSNGKYQEVKSNLKYYLKMLPKPLIVVDEAGDLEYTAFLELKELWNATEGSVGWYMMGAEGLRAKIDKGIRNHKIGFREIFSRYAERYTTIVPQGRQEKILFYRKLVTDVLTANMDDKSSLERIVNKCITQDQSGSLGGLRRAESLLILINQ